MRFGSERTRAGFGRSMHVGTPRRPVTFVRESSCGRATLGRGSKGRMAVTVKVRLTWTISTLPHGLRRIGALIAPYHQKAAQRHALTTFSVEATAHPFALFRMKVASILPNDAPVQYQSPLQSFHSGTDNGKSTADPRRTARQPTMRLPRLTRLTRLMLDRSHGYLHIACV